MTELFGSALNRPVAREAETTSLRRLAGYRLQCKRNPERHNLGNPRFAHGSPRFGGSCWLRNVQLSPSEEHQWCYLPARFPPRHTRGICASGGDHWQHPRPVHLGPHGICYPTQWIRISHRGSLSTRGLSLHSHIRVWAQKSVSGLTNPRANSIYTHKSVYGLRNPCVDSQIYKNLAAF